MYQKSVQVTDLLSVVQIHSRSLYTLSASALRVVVVVVDERKGEEKRREGERAGEGGEAPKAADCLSWPECSSFSEEVWQAHLSGGWGKPGVLIPGVLLRTGVLF